MSTRSRMSLHRTISGFIVFTALTTLSHCANKTSSQEPNRACAGAQALQTAGLRGTSMPPKTLALTFDDGPGARTKQLSLYLKNQGIQAAFFVNGRSMGPDATEILQAVVDDGHLVANHTETHRSLTGVATNTPRLADNDVIQELTQTDTKIEGFIPSKRLLFRPPFGDYDDQTFSVLSGSAMNKYVGPILWDVGDRMDLAAGRAADWDCWQDGADGKRIPMKECGDLYVTEIKHTDHGIVLMHDPYFNEADPEQLGTVDMVMYIVPILKEAGFNFTRVDKVPEIAALLPPPLADEADAGATSNALPTPPNAAPAPTKPANPCQ
jgi:peptidoglycan/xylan/chitin deacetylase (PgdA/CDA1 family)